MFLGEHLRHLEIIPAKSFIWNTLFFLPVWEWLNIFLVHLIRQKLLTIGRIYFRRQIFIDSYVKSKQKHELKDCIQDTPIMNIGSSYKANRCSHCSGLWRCSIKLCHLLNVPGTFSCTWLYPAFRYCWQDILPWNVCSPQEVIWCQPSARKGQNGIRNLNKIGNGIKLLKSPHPEWKSVLEKGLTAPTLSKFLFCDKDSQRKIPTVGSCSSY